MYDTFKFLHVVSAIVWLGSGVCLMVLMGSLRRANDGPALVGVTRQLDGLGKRLFGPASMSTLLFGVLTVLVSEGAWEFTDAWILIGLGGIAFSLVSVFRRNSLLKKLNAALDDGGPANPEFAANAKRVGMVNQVDLVLLFIVVAAMVFKPGA
jgi:uncharacterized membrane protein